MPRILITAALCLIASSAHAICDLNVRYSANPPALVWDPVPGALTIEVQESFDNFRTSHNFFLKSAPFPIAHRASVDTKVYYTVTALMQSNVQSIGPLVEGCTDQLIVTLKGDPEFRTLTRRAVVPVVGSGPGANGSTFRTSIRLTSNAPNERGRLIFHPAGRAAQQSDPWLPYDLGAAIGEEIFYSDIVDSMRRSGLGSLDIVPDEGASESVPIVEARLYNDTPGGTIGTTTPALFPYDFLTPAPFSFKIPSSNSDFRINLGLRTLAAVSANALIYGTNGRLRDFALVSWPPDYMVLGSAKDVLGIDLEQGESFTLHFDGPAIAFYTKTENRTNDPELIIGRPAPVTNVGAYVE